MGNLGISSNNAQEGHINLRIVSKNSNIQVGKPLELNPEQAAEYDKLRSNLKNIRLFGQAVPALIGSIATTIATAKPEKFTTSGRNFFIGLALTVGSTILADKITKTICDKQEQNFIEKVNTFNSLA